MLMMRPQKCQFQEFEMNKPLRKSVTIITDCKLPILNRKSQTGYFLFHKLKPSGFSR